MAVAGAVGPASHGQHRLWLAEQLAPGAYVIQRAFRLRGAVDEDAVRRAADRLAARHEALRTTYRAARGGIEQVVGEPGAVFDAVDAADVDAVIAAERAARFDLAAGPVLRVRLLRTAADDAVLLLTIHHIAFDGWSMEVFFREFAAAYAAFAAGEEPDLPPAPGFLDHVRREAGRDHAASLEFWRRTLAGAPPVSLPADPAPAGPGGAHAVPVALSDATTARIDRLSRERRCTAYMTTLVLYAAVLARRAGLDEAVLATAASGRLRAEDQNLVGFLSNTVPLRVACPPDATLVEAVDAAREVCLAASEHGAAPYDQVVAASGVARPPGRAPLAQALFDLRPAPGVPELPGLRVEERPIEPTATRLELELHLVRGGAGVRGHLLASPAVLTADTARTLRDRFTRLAAAWTAEPDSQLKEMP